jgi:hypothetical protein
MSDGWLPAGLKDRQNRRRMRHGAGHLKAQSR